MKTTSLPLRALALVAILFATLSSFAGEYSAWTPFRGWSGLEYRVKCAEYNDSAHKYEWHVQFRNNYVDRINFSFHLDEPGTSSARLTDRMSLNAGRQDWSWTLLYSSSRIEVFVGNVRFGTGDFGPYATPN